ncbi:MAG: TonB-dependent receptor plug domain-containing protein [Methylophilaceae bacterium]|nr:TonB-dependent receptor plug domain-containing protein [Methylophilaceae bacterium]
MKKTTIASVIGLLFSSQLYAQDAVQTADVIVTATRFSEINPAIPANISIITKADIENTPAISVPDLLKTQAGINVSSFYGNQGIDSTVDIRSFGESALSNTLILLDGQRLNSVDGSSIQWATIPVNSLERIEIIRGSGSVLYGDRASGA